MRVMHDSRDVAYRLPYGAVKAGEQVALCVDVCDSPGATVLLRTWEDGVGETLYEMEAVESTRYRATLAPDSPGIVWYQFVITDTEGYVWRYGACNGRVGGTGQLVGWEPPSFQLSVYDHASDAPAWHEPIGGFLHGGGVRHGLQEVIATLCENYPVELCGTAAPWDVAGRCEIPPDGLPTMREAYNAINRSECSWFAVNDDVFGFWRESEGGNPTCALLNASPDAAYDLPVPMVREAVSELVAGYGVDVKNAADMEEPPETAPAADRYAIIHLWQFGSAILHFHAHARLAEPMDAGLGILAHITSLPTENGTSGTLGAPARAFVDWLAQAGVRFWQVLPVNPVDDCGSPYAGMSAFAGNTLLLEGGADAEAGSAFSEEGYRAFCEREAAWLEPYACFSALSAKFGNKLTWREWPDEYRRYNPALLQADAQLRASAEAARRLQYAFERQWGELRAYANERGVRIIGDIPIYVNGDSADVWAHPELFLLDADGNPRVVAGCPPDAFAVDGQVWNSPVYDWAAAEADGYSWWLSRLKRVFDLYDYVRLDHFIGFSRYFTIPAGDKAAAGSFHLGPGYGFFESARDRFGKLPIIAEDLGLITPRVRSLVADCGFPGMDIVQFVDGNDPLSGYAPRPEKIVYTGTHDNQTLLGYVRSRYPHADGAQAAAAIIEKAVTCFAPVCILPLQDVMALGDEARMNVPGVAEGNWAWKAEGAEVAAALERTRRLAQLHADAVSPGENG